MNIWSQVNAVDEDFSTNFISMFNVGFSLTTQFSRWMTGSLNGLKFASLKGSYVDALPEKNFFLPILAGTNIIVLFIGGLLIIKQKIKNRSKINPVMNTPKFNIVAYNKPLLNTKHAFTLMFIITSNLVVFCVSLSFSPNDKTEGIYIVLFQIFMFIIFPIYVMITRITITRFILREILNF